jgi:hypothetical protein
MTTVLVVVETLEVVVWEINMAEVVVWEVELVCRVEVREVEVVKNVVGPLYGPV